ncbi:hypothetical protein ACW2Q0_20960 [Nocardia sp. R16R-3T]
MITASLPARVAEIAELAPDLANRDEQLRRRRSDLDRRYGELKRADEPIPRVLVDDQHAVRDQLTELAAQRRELLDELAELRRTALAPRLSQLRSRSAARKHGLLLTREEYDAALAEVRCDQATFDRTRDWLNGAIPRAREEGKVLAAIIASCHDPLSFDSNDW